MTTLLPDFDGLLDWPRLQEWIIAQPLPGSGPVTAIERLSGGSQNNLFLLSRKDARFVLRRPPKHLRANSNQTMLREARVLSALKGSAVPHPEFFAACADETVIGAAFYVMAPLDGFTPIGKLPGGYASEPEWRRAMGIEMVTAAAALGAVDHETVGLRDFGKPDNWLERQVSRWRTQLESYRDLPNYPGASLPHVDEISAWLERHRPAQCRIGIIHGDFQFANVMFHKDAPRMAGLIDWELSTLGDPLLDLGWILTSWTEPGDPDVGGRKPAVEPWDGFVSRDVLVKLYGDLSGRDMSDMPWFFVLACFKLACLLEGTYARACAGKASKEMGDFLHNYALWLMAKARQLAT
ncbi:phosphotransferase family protein [Noviherbaspirillum saxi]|uniref:Phosphotransferase family protein n=1 Tax=Noviherbaspirillum saxi TaxID=2320863 RepID=A0A3A3FX93_9BURK|nr:phosphotransferase family protein [Noviherbaspirillum saxi]RJF91689.1 phosphotransferase family protein [Noviherbaspirillum saxi]